MKIQLINFQKIRFKDEADLKKTARKILKLLGEDKAELSVVLASDKKIRQLNRKFRNKDKPTDVLAFSMRGGKDPGINPALLGDVVISVETAYRYAGEQKIRKKEEVYRYLVHGILHLLGFRDENAIERLKMQKRQEGLLKRVGIC